MRASIVETKDNVLATRPPTVSQVKQFFYDLKVGLVAGFRSDHTVVSFVSPSEDDDALTSMQVVQLFCRLC